MSKDKFPDWRPVPPYTWGDYFYPMKIGYDHRFIPFGYKRDFRELESVQKWCAPSVVDSIKRLPNCKLILPELLVHTRWFPMEPMLAVLMEQKWDRPASWKVYARLLMVRRIGAGKERLFMPFEMILEELSQFILYGGTRKGRNQLLRAIRDVTVTDMQVPHVHASARFLASCLIDDPTLALIRPFHWLRAAYIATDPVVALGVGEFQKEMRAQKVDLVDLMLSKVSKRLIEDLS